MSETIPPDLKKTEGPKKFKNLHSSEEGPSKSERGWPQLQLPLFPKDMLLINNHIGVKQEEDTIYYFHGSMPIFSHHINDHNSFRMITAQLYVNGNAKQREIMKAFGVSAISVKRAVKVYRTEGIEGFYKQRALRRPTVLTPEVLEEAQRLLDEGEIIKEVAAQLNIKKDTLQKACFYGRLKVPDLKKKKF